MGTIASKITSLTIVYSNVYLGADQRKHQSSASLALARGIHRGPVNSPHKWPVTRKMFSFDDVIMRTLVCYCSTPVHCDEIYHLHVRWKMLDFNILVVHISTLNTQVNNIRKFLELKSFASIGFTWFVGFDDVVCQHWVFMHVISWPRCK